MKGKSVHELLNDPGLKSRIEKMKNKMYGGSSFVKENSRSIAYKEYLHYFIFTSIKTIGVITSSKLVVDEDAGYKIKFKYKDYKGTAINGEGSLFVHWPSKEHWDNMTKRMVKGSNVIVFYDPEETNIYELFYLD